MKKVDQVDRTVLGTVDSCILKVLRLTLPILHYNVQRLKSLTSVLIRIQDQYSFSFFGVGDYITDIPVCSLVGPGFRLSLLFLRKIIRMPRNYMNALVLCSLCETPLFLNSVQSSFSSFKLVSVFT